MMSDTKIKTSTLPRTIGGLVQLRGRDDAERIFITSPESATSMTFGQYHLAVRALAATLRKRGVARGARVALVLGNGLNAAVASLGIMAAGGVAVPLNPRLQEAEITRLLEHAGVRLVISDRLHAGALSTGIRCNTPDSMESHEADNRYTFYPVKSGVAETSPSAGLTLSENDPALILFTSGTTGHPKGVVLTHGNLLANAGYVTSAHRLTSDDAALCVLPVYHINGFVVTLLAPLLSGSQVVMPQRFRVENFWRWVRDYRATWFSAVPTILSILLSHPDPPASGLATLRFARSASAPLPVAILEEFERRFGIPVIETYGISEAACQVTANPLPPLTRKPGSAGIPCSNDLAVVDVTGRPLLPGVTGEVVIRGANVFGGYLDNPAADREALQGGWFHTGDLGFLDDDGYLFLTGRTKELINRAGEKISPREVEEVIHRLAEVEAVGVIGVPNHLYGEEIAAFVTVRQGKSVAADQIRTFCRQHLAGFKVPREVFIIDEFPKGPSGKIQRKRLLDVYQELTSSETKETTA